MVKEETKEEKADRILEEGGVVYVGRTVNWLKFAVKGKRQKHYTVYRSVRGKPDYKCDCLYSCFSRGEPCSHIIAVAKYAVGRRFI
jgi:hypothetical protein